MAETIQFVAGAADTLLRVTPTSLDAERAVFTIATGPWLGDFQLGSVRGALGIPLDDVTGYVVASAAPPGRWPVSLGIRMDFLADVPLDGGPVTLVGELITRTSSGAATRGAAYNEAGDVLALVTQRSHLVEVAGHPQSAIPDAPLPDSDVPLREVLGFSTVAAGELTMSPTGWAENIMGNVHGGVLIVGSELAAHSAVGEGFSTVSIDTAYVRPCNASSVTGFHATIAHQGRTVAVVRVEATLADGRPCTVATVVLQR